MLLPLFSRWGSDSLNMLFNMITNHLNVDDERTAILAQFLLVVCFWFFANCLQIMSNWSHLILEINIVHKGVSL